MIRNKLPEGEAVAGRHKFKILHIVFNDENKMKRIILIYKIDNIKNLKIQQHKHYLPLDPTLFLVFYFFFQSEIRNFIISSLPL
jgi:hypothetical protein